MKKIYLIILAAVSLFKPFTLQTKPIKSPQNNIQKPTQLLLQNMKYHVNQKRLETIKNLEKTRNRRKKLKVQLLKERTRIGQIKIIWKNGSTLDLKFSNSADSIKHLDKNLEFLIKNNFKFDKKNIDVYTSGEIDFERNMFEFFLGSRNTETYFASIFVD